MAFMYISDHTNVAVIPGAAVRVEGFEATVRTKRGNKLRIYNEKEEWGYDMVGPIEVAAIRILDAKKKRVLHNLPRGSASHGVRTISHPYFFFRTDVTEMHGADVRVRLRIGTQEWIDMKHGQEVPGEGGKPYGFLDVVRRASLDDILQPFLRDMEAAKEERGLLAAELEQERTERKRVAAELGREQAERKHLAGVLDLERVQRKRTAADLEKETAQRKRLHVELGQETEQRKRLVADLELERAQRRRLERPGPSTWEVHYTSEGTAHVRGLRHALDLVKAELAELKAKQ